MFVYEYFYGFFTTLKNLRQLDLNVLVLIQLFSLMDIPIVFLAELC